MFVYKCVNGIVRNGELVAKGANRVVPNNDPTAHAEVMAIRNACRECWVPNVYHWHRKMQASRFVPAPGYISGVSVNLLRGE